MNRKIMIAFLFAAGILVAPAYYSYVVDAFAQSPAAPVAAQAAGPVAVGEAMAQKDKQDHVAIIAVAPQTQPGVIDTGTIAGDALTWVITTFGGTIGLALTGLLYRFLQKAGVDLTEAQRDKLQGIVVNGLNLGAAKASAELQGKGQIEIKNAAVAAAVTYAQTHGADTLKALGMDPTSQAAVEAIKARIETAIADDNTPTHPALSVPSAPAAATAAA